MKLEPLQAEAWPTSMCIGLPQTENYEKPQSIYKQVLPTSRVCALVRYGWEELQEYLQVRK